jgi:hypothetical protein
MAIGLVPYFEKTLLEFSPVVSAVSVGSLALFTHFTGSTGLATYNSFLSKVLAYVSVRLDTRGYSWEGLLTVVTRAAAEPHALARSRFCRMDGAQRSTRSAVPGRPLANRGRSS